MQQGPKEYGAETENLLFPLMNGNHFFKGQKPFSAMLQLDTSEKTKPFCVTKEDSLTFFFASGEILLRIENVQGWQSDNPSSVM